MPNALTPSGIVTNSQAEWIDYFTNGKPGLPGMKQIYGDDIVLTQDTPDGQQMLLLVQALVDLGELIKQSFTSFDPDEAIGTTLDRRVTLNGIQRKEGTYTTQLIDIEVSQALTLFGEDDGEQVQEIYTVSDNAGTKWKLLDTQNFVSGGTYTAMFRSEFPGAYITIPNTINVPVTIVLGVESVNNTTVQAVLGINEETDYRLKIRRRKSVGLSSQGYQDSLEALLNNIDGITFATVIENDASVESDDGLPPNSIWVIVEGTAEDAAIADAIYRKRNAGATMVGEESYLVLRPNGSTKLIRWDEVVQENLFIKMNLDSIDGIVVPNIQAIKTQIPLLLQPQVNEKLNINTIAALVQQIDPNAIATNIGLGKAAAGPFTPTLSPSSRRNRFVAQSANIIILAMQMFPPEIAAIESGDTRQFVAYGGYGAITWSIQTNESGCTLVAGLYTAGPTPGTDVIRATDSLGNNVQALIGVI